MEIQNPDCPAFAFTPVNPDPFNPHYHKGLTKREYIAATALQGVLASDKDITADDAVLFAIACTDKLLEDLGAE